MIAAGNGSAENVRVNIIPPFMAQLWEIKGARQGRGQEIKPLDSLPRMWDMGPPDPSSLFKWMLGVCPSPHTLCLIQAPR